MLLRLRRLATFAFVTVATLGLDCESDPAGSPPALLQIPGTYRAEMTLRSLRGNTALCPDTGHTFSALTVIVDPVTANVTVQFAFPVTGPYNAVTGAYSGSGRTDYSSQLDLVLDIDGTFSRDSGRIALVGTAVVSFVAAEGGNEFCARTLDLSMERTAS